MIDSTEMGGIYRGFSEYLISREFVWNWLCISSHWLEKWVRKGCCFVATCDALGKMME
jgi:hypothetical protein